jgi:hypothetical protein
MRGSFIKVGRPRKGIEQKLIGLSCLFWSEAKKDNKDTPKWKPHRLRDPYYKGRQFPYIS